jgi:hypothetical protein
MSTCTNLSSSHQITTIWLVVLALDHLHEGCRRLSRPRKRARGHRTARTHTWPLSEVIPISRQIVPPDTHTSIQVDATHTCGRLIVLPSGTDLVRRPCTAEPTNPEHRNADQHIIFLKEGESGGSFQRFGCLLGCSWKRHVVVQHLQD